MVLVLRTVPKSSTFSDAAAAEALLPVIVPTRIRAMANGPIRLTNLFKNCSRRDFSIAFCAYFYPKNVCSEMPLVTINHVADCIDCSLDSWGVHLHLK